jgi:Fe-S-cluster containining protein
MKCTRCGTCCKKGGPSFHLEDKPLIENGIILLKSLYTLRKGESAYDNVRGYVSPVPSDIIKIKGRKNRHTCIFFDENESACTIYENRPLECRVLACWDTREIEQVYSQNRLTRKELLFNIAGLWELIEEHQFRCDYDNIRQLVKALSGDRREEARQNLLEMLQYDADIRELVVEKSGIAPEITDFLFGRALSETISPRNQFQQEQKGQ